MKKLNSNQLKVLLDKYFAGSTTLQEEAILFKYFTEGTSVNDEFMSYRSQFMLFKDSERTVPELSDIQSKMSDFIDDQIVNKRRTLNGRQLRRLLVAASVALLAGVTYLFIYHNQKFKTGDTFTDPQIAYNEAQKTLMYISQKFQSGIRPLSNIEKINAGKEQLIEIERIDIGKGVLETFNYTKSDNSK
jgi:hypothetical protein